MRFDERVSMSDFKGLVLVTCPRCSGCAHLVWLSAHGEEREGRVVSLAGNRLVCTTCAYTTDWLRQISSEAPPAIGLGPVLEEFGLELWLQRPCCGEVLWAYNAPHLQFLAEYVGAQQRERWPDTNEGWQPLGGLGRRLPQWMLLAKNREAVLHGIEALRERLL